MATPRHEKSNDTPKPENRIRSISVTDKSPVAEPKKHSETDSELVVKLKFSKAKAPTVKQILRLPPKRTNEKKEQREPSKEPSTESRIKPVDGPVIKKKAIPKVAARRGEIGTPSSSSTVVDAKPPVPSTKISEKRSRTDDDATLAVPGKRPRTQPTQDRPITPVPQLASTLSSKPSTQKGQAQFSTPKKDPKAVTMLRTTSAESYDTTPGRSGATPAGVKLESRAGPTSAPLNGKKQTDISLLAHMSMKLNQMGRALKHEATKILITAGKNLTKQDEKRAAVTNLECIL